MAKVLLVEDDNNLREIYEARLQAEGYDIVSARDGEEALVVAKAEMPDLVISDVMMPKISGFEMLDILRSTEGLKDVKVIMLTALGQAEDQTRADSLGADRYLVKSQVTLEDIVNAASDLLGGGAAAPADAVAPVAGVAAADPVTPAPAPTPEPVTTAAPVVNEPVAVAPAPATPADPTPVIPLAAPPTEDEVPDVSPQMPPTPASTVPDVTAEEQGVSVEPTPAPVEPAADPVTPAPAPAPEATTPQSSQEESSAVEQQIASFIESQTGMPEATVEPQADEAPAPAPTTEPTETTSAEQEQALNDALTTLNGTDTATPAPEAATSDSVPAADATSKRIIEPLTADPSAPQKSLEDLLKEEDAREAAAAGMPAAPAPEPAAPVAAPTPEPAAPAPTVESTPVQPAPTEPGTPNTPASPTKPNGDFDPHSIAL